jgi:hypothetical protein
VIHACGILSLSSPARHSRKTIGRRAGVEVRRAQLCEAGHRWPEFNLKRELAWHQRFRIRAGVVRTRVVKSTQLRSGELTLREESMTTIMAFRLASVVTAIDVLVSCGFSIAAIIRPQVLVPAESARTRASLLLAMYAAAPRIPLALLVLGAIYNQATPPLLILGALAGAMQLLDAGIGLFQRDLRKWAGPLFFAVLQFFVVYLLHISVRITP